MNFLSLKKRGISIVEIIIAAGVMGVSIVGITGAIQVYLKIVYQNTREAQAVLYLDETAEILQYLRDVSYSTHFEDFDEEQEYTVFWNGTGYEMSTSTVTLPYDMNRSVQLLSVARDSSDQIVETGGTIDTQTTKAIVTIAWPYADGVETVSAEVLIHDLYEN